LKPERWGSLLVQENYQEEMSCDKRHKIIITIIIIIIIIIIVIKNFVQKEAKKKLKYKSLCIEIQGMWNLECTIIPVIIAATGIVTRSLRKNLEAVPREHSIDSLQKRAVLGISHIIRKVLQCEA
jgi:heme/copper-type cytochrome/quinol oxidase subunit 2